MRHPPFFRLARLVTPLVLSAMLACAQAVELGDTLVRSHIGQPLSADIELTGIVNEAATVRAELADAEVYRGANIAIHPALAALNIALVRRDGKRFLHLTSSRPVDAEYIHIFFELNENGRRAVRQTTLWFTPDPQPAPLKPAPPAAAPAAPPLHTAPVRPMPRIIAPVLPMSPMRAPAARPAAGVQRFTAAQIGTCAALDAKNAALNAQIVDLEEKVRLLTLAMHAGAVSMAPAATPTPTPARAVLTVPSKPLASMGAPVDKPGRSTPWLFIGIASAAVFTLVGGLLYLLRRKRKPARSTPAVPAAPGFIASVRDRLLPGRQAAQTAAPADAAAD